MGVIAKHAYRNGFLKSEFWDNLRLEALVKFQACCYICHKENIKNDAHHVDYPKRWRDTRLNQLVIMCRECHELMHKKLGDRKATGKLFREISTEMRMLAGTHVQRTKGRRSVCKKAIDPCMICSMETSTRGMVKSGAEFNFCQKCDNIFEAFCESNLILNWKDWRHCIDWIYAARLGELISLLTSSGFFGTSSLTLKPELNNRLLVRS